MAGRDHSQGGFEFAAGATQRSMREIADLCSDRLPSIGASPFSALGKAVPLRLGSTLLTSVRGRRLHLARLGFPTRSQAGVGCDSYIIVVLTRIVRIEAS